MRHLKIITNIYRLLNIEGFSLRLYLTHLKILFRIKAKVMLRKKISVLFLVTHGSVWQYEGVYSKFEEDPQYEIKIVITPYTLYGKSVMIDNLRRTKTIFSKLGYNVFVAYDEEKNTYIDIKNHFHPDIVFFTNPHELTEPQYYIHNFITDCLTCYVPYGFLTANIQQLQFNQPFHNLLWRYFLPLTIHKHMAEKYADNKGINTIVVGYPKCDAFIARDRKFTNPWKNTGKQLKRLIWAPHHTIEDDNLELGYSTFERYAQVMLELAHRYKDHVQFTLKPHPLLWTKLHQSKTWNDSQIRKYRQIWIDGQNTQLEEGSYLDLFYYSDGMILDSISFISEYPYLDRPHLFIEKDKHTKHKFNEYGKLAYAHVYKARGIEDIKSFIEAKIIGAKDPKAHNRHRFVKENLIPPHGKLASELIYEHINQVFRQSLYLLLLSIATQPYCTSDFVGYI